MSAFTVPPMILVEGSYLFFFKSETRFLGCSFCPIINEANHCPVQSSSVHSSGFDFCLVSLTVPHSHTVRKGEEGMKFLVLSCLLVFIKIEVSGG